MAIYVQKKGYYNSSFEGLVIEVNTEDRDFLIYSLHNGVKDIRFETKERGSSSYQKDISVKAEDSDLFKKLNARVKNIVTRRNLVFENKKATDLFSIINRAFALNEQKLLSGKERYRQEYEYNLIMLKSISDSFREKAELSNEEFAFLLQI